MMNHPHNSHTDQQHSCFNVDRLHQTVINTTTQVTASFLRAQKTLPIDEIAHLIQTTYSCFMKLAGLHYTPRITQTLDSLQSLNIDTTPQHILIKEVSSYIKKYYTSQNTPIQNTPMHKNLESPH